MFSIPIILAAPGLLFGCLFGPAAPFAVSYTKVLKFMVFHFCPFGCPLFPFWLPFLGPCSLSSLLNIGLDCAHTHTYYTAGGELARPSTAGGVVIWTRTQPLAPSRGSCSKASRILRRLCQTILVVWGRSGEIYGFRPLSSFWLLFWARCFLSSRLKFRFWNSAFRLLVGLVVAVGVHSAPMLVLPKERHASKITMLHVIQYNTSRNGLVGR